MVFTPSQELRITRYPCLNEENLNISELVDSPLTELIEKESASVKKEEELCQKIEDAVAEWETQAKETIRLRKALEYLKTLPVEHTSNQWVEDGINRYAISNMVYRMTCSVSKNTLRYGKGKEPTTRWVVSWSLMFNSPRKPMDYRSGWHIAGQDNKCYLDKAEMEKYLRGRIKAYSHLFTEISPPIPEKDQKHFLINGTLFKGYTVEAPELLKPDKEQVDDLLSLLLDEDISGEALGSPPAQPEEQTPEAVWSRNRQQRQKSGKTPRPPTR